MKEEVKTLGEGGRILLGEEYTGQHVLVTQERAGVWTIKTADVVPHDEKWFNAPEVQEKITHGLEWARTHPFKETTLEEIDERIRQLATP